MVVGGGNSSSSSYHGPFLLAAIPATGSQTDDVDTEIKATFSEPVQFNSFHVSVGGVKVDGVASGKGKKTLKFTPKHKLQHGAKYTVTITGVKGMSGAVNPRTGGIESWFFSINPPSFVYTTAAASGNDEGHYNSIVYTQTHGAVIAYYINDNQSIKMLTTMDGKIFDQHPYYFTDMDVDADDITLLADNSGYHLLYLHKFDGLIYVSNNDLGKDDDGITNKWTKTKVDAGISSRTYASMAIDKPQNPYKLL